MERNNLKGGISVKPQGVAHAANVKYCGTYRIAYCVSTAKTPPLRLSERSELWSGTSPSMPTIKKFETETETPESHRQRAIGKKLDTDFKSSLVAEAKKCDWVNDNADAVRDEELADEELR